MKIIKTNLSKNFETLEIHTFADEHIGDPHSDIENLKRRIDHVAKTENAYCILNGDILDFTSRSSIGDIEGRKLNIMKQLEKAVELFEPIKKKIICVTNGNHENRGYRKEGFDISSVLASRLDLSDVYTPTSAFIFLRFGAPPVGKNKSQKQIYTMYVNHGSGGGRKEGAKAIRLADMAAIIDADIYIHSHTHLPMIFKEGFHRVDRDKYTVHNDSKLFVNTASNLDYGGYGEAQEYKPNSKDTPVIHLSGSKRDMYAIL